MIFRGAAASALLTIALAACATGPQEDLAERCVRTGGWWHGVEPDSLFSGFCEHQSPRFP